MVIVVFESLSEAFSVFFLDDTGNGFLDLFFIGYSSESSSEFESSDLDLTFLSLFEDFWLFFGDLSLFLSFLADF